VKFHLKKSKSHNPHFTLISHHVKHIEGESPEGSDDEDEVDYSIIPYSISSFLDNPSFTLFADHRYLLDEKDCTGIAGSCNGLICLTGFRYFPATSTLYYIENEYWFRLWNPATRAISEKFGYFIGSRGFDFNFGCDNSTGTFKVVASHYIHDRSTSDVRVLSFGDSVWKNIESFPVVPLNVDSGAYGPNAVFFNGTLNWLAIHNYTRDTWFRQLKYLTVEQFVIVSLDLGTATYNVYTLPQGFAELPPVEPTVGVLRDCLCFSYCAYNESDFIIWQMKKFGDEESWTQFFKISFHDLQLDCDFSDNMLKYSFHIMPLFLSKDGDTLVLSFIGESQAILYNWRDRRVERSGVSVHKIVIDDETYNELCWDDANGFVESLISIC
jgi:F-box interacting protein